VGSLKANCCNISITLIFSRSRVFSGELGCFSPITIGGARVQFRPVVDESAGAPAKARDVARECRADGTFTSFFSRALA
jgi:hypothetical protein